jgi:hypothetical protein
VKFKLFELRPKEKVEVMRLCPRAKKCRNWERCDRFYGTFTQRAIEIPFWWLPFHEYETCMKSKECIGTVKVKR